MHLRSLVGVMVFGVLSRIVSRVGNAGFVLSSFVKVSSNLIGLGRYVG